MQRSSRPTVLVTGGGGFLGGAIGVALGNAGMSTHVTWRTSPPPGGLPAHRVEVDDIDQVTTLIGEVDPDIVINAIGGPHRPSTAAQRSDAWRDSPIATWTLLEACRGREMRFIHLASSHEYTPSAAPHHETSPTNPVSLRGVTSLAATGAVRLWAADTGAPTVILRPFSVYGPGEPGDRVVPTVLRAALGGTPFRTTTAHCYRDFVFVGDIAAAVMTACRDTVTGEFNLGSGVGTSVSQLVGAAEFVTGRTITVLEGEFEQRPWDRDYWVADPARAAAVLGWKAETALIDGLRRSLP
jgi:nucleoside-diphosphate-sugar epimerase